MADRDPARDPRPGDRLRTEAGGLTEVRAVTPTTVRITDAHGAIEVARDEWAAIAEGASVVGRGA